MQFVRISKENLTDKFLEDLHLTIFGYRKSAKDFRIDGGYAAEKDDGTLFGYLLYKELSDSEVELMYGGIERDMRGFSTFKVYKQFLDLMFEKYSSIVTSVWNKNFPMLKIYLGLEFEVVGTKLLENNSLLLILNKRKEG